MSPRDILLQYDGLNGESIVVNASNNLDLSDAFARLQGTLQSQNSDKALLAHIHIPKTAGMFAQQVLMQNLTPAIHLPWDDAGREWKKIAASKVGSIKLLSGHIKFAELNFENFQHSRPIFCTSVLRDPLDRVVSLYNYSRSVRHPEHKEFFKRHSTLESYVKTFIGVPNRQCRWLADETQSAEIVEERINQNYIGLAVQGYLNWYFREVCERVSPAGYYQVSKLGKVNELGAIPEGKIVSADDLGQGIISEFRDRNALDLKVYNAALNFYEQNNIPKDKVVSNTASGGASGGNIVKKVKRIFFGAE